MTMLTEEELNVIDGMAKRVTYYETNPKSLLKGFCNRKRPIVEMNRPDYDRLIAAARQGIAVRNEALTKLMSAPADGSDDDAMTADDYDRINAKINAHFDAPPAQSVKESRKQSIPLTDDEMMRSLLPTTTHGSEEEDEGSSDNHYARNNNNPMATDSLKERLAAHIKKANETNLGYGLDDAEHLIEEALARIEAQSVALEQAAVALDEAAKLLEAELPGVAEIMRNHAKLARFRGV